MSLCFNRADPLVGLPLSNLEPVGDTPNGSTAQKSGPVTDLKNATEKKESKQKAEIWRSPNSIVFLRRRILYGRDESQKGKPCGLGQTRMCIV